MVVSADATLRELLVALDGNPFLFVVDGAEINGLITVSDLNREGARAYFFLLCVDLEMALALQTRQRFRQSKENLVSSLAVERQKVVRARLKLQKTYAADIDEVACMDLRDLIELSLPVLADVLSGSARLAWEALTARTDRNESVVVRLRHDTAHATEWSSLVGRRSLSELRVLEACLRDLLLFFETRAQT
jgi:hypothetical protein